MVTSGGGDSQTLASPWPRWCRIAGWVLTALLPVAVLGAASFWRLADGFVDADFRAPSLLAIDLLVAGGACVLLRRRWPLGTLVIAAVAAVAVAMLGFSMAGAIFFPLLILPTVAYRGTRLQVAFGAAVVLCQFLAMNTVENEHWHTPPVGMAVSIGLLVGVGLVGRVITGWVQRRPDRHAGSLAGSPAGWPAEVTPPGWPVTTAAGPPLSSWPAPVPGAPPVVAPVVAPFAAPQGVAPEATTPTAWSVDHLPSGPPARGSAAGWRRSVGTGASSFTSSVSRHRVLTATVVIAVALLQVGGWALFRPRSDATAGVQPWGPPLVDPAAGPAPSAGFVFFGSEAAGKVAADRRGVVFDLSRDPNSSLRLSGLAAGGDLLWSVLIADTGSGSWASEALLAADAAGDVAVAFRQRDQTSAAGIGRPAQSVVVVFDRAGTELWRSTVADLDPDSMASLAIAGRDRVYLGVDRVRADPTSAATDAPAAVVALGDGGTARWRTNLDDSTRRARAPDVALDGTGQVYVATAGRLDGVALRRLADDGTVAWVVDVPMADDRAGDQAGDPLLAFDGNADQLYVSQTWRASILFGTPTPGAGDGERSTMKVTVAAIGTAGDERWRYTDTDMDRSIEALVALPGGGVMVAGSVVPTLAGRYPVGRPEAIFDRLDAAGRLVQRDRYARPDGAQPSDLAAVPDGSVVAVGSSATGDPSWSTGLTSPARWRVQISGPP